MLNYFDLYKYFPHPKTGDFRPKTRDLGCLGFGSPGVGLKSNNDDDRDAHFDFLVTYPDKKNFFSYSLIL